MAEHDMDSQEQRIAYYEEARALEPVIFTLVATGQTLTPLSEVEYAVRITLQAKGVELIPCNWAPDADTITDAVQIPADATVAILDLD
jgi:hypothetical protein